MVLGFGALAFAVLLASLVWDGCHGGECFVTLQSLERPILTFMTVSIAVGVAAIVCGILLKRARPGSNADMSQKKLP
jgi:hypothetical protein